MKITSKDFNRSPAHVYRAADKGATVEIEHKHYPDKRFVLTAEDKCDEVECIFYRITYKDIDGEIKHAAAFPSKEVAIFELNNLKRNYPKTQFYLCTEEQSGFDKFVEGLGDE